MTHRTSRWSEHCGRSAACRDDSGTAPVLRLGHCEPAAKLPAHLLPCPYTAPAALYAPCPEHAASARCSRYPASSGPLTHSPAGPPRKVTQASPNHAGGVGDPFQASGPAYWRPAPRSLQRAASEALSEDAAVSPCSGPAALRASETAYTSAQPIYGGEWSPRSSRVHANRPPSGAGQAALFLPAAFADQPYSCGWYAGWRCGASVPQ